MMSVIRASLAFSLMPALAGFAASQSKAPGRSAEAHSPAGEVRAVLDAQAAAWNRGDVDSFMEGYWKSRKTTFVGASGVLRGWREVLERYKRTYPDRATMGTLTFSDLEVTVLSPASALVLGRWRLERGSDNPGGVFTLVFRKFPEGWRIIHDHTTQEGRN